MKTENFEPVNEPKTNGNGKTKLLVICIIVILLVVAIAAVVVAGSSSPKAIFQKQINKILTYEEAVSYDTIKANMDLEVEVEGKDTKEVADLINDAKISFNLEMDTRTKEELVGIKLEKAKNEIINIRTKADLESNKAFVDLGEFFNKPIEVDISEITDEFSESESSDPLTFMQLVNAKKAETILKKEVKEQLKEEYFSSEKVTIDDANLTKNVLKTSGKELEDVITNVCNNLSKNDEFINCFEDGEDLKNSLEEMASTVEEMEIPEDMIFEIDIYTAGIFKKVNRVDVIATEDEESVAIQVTKTADEEYAYQLLADDEKIAEGTIKVHEIDDKTEMEVSIEAEETKVIVKLATNTVYDEELSSFDTSNSVKLEDLSQTDMMALYGNFMGSKLYEVIEEISGSIDELPSMTKEESKNDKTSETSKQTSSSIKSSLKDNVVKTYDDDAVEFSIPDGFEAYSSDSEHYKLFEKKLEDGSIDVDVSMTYSTLDEYIEEVKGKLEYYEEDDDYKNVKMSDVEEITVNGKKFHKIVISYEYVLFDDETEKYEDTYIAYEMNEDYLYTVEIENSNLINENELKQFLKIEK